MTRCSVLAVLIALAGFAAGSVVRGQTAAVLADPQQKGSYAAEPPQEALSSVRGLAARLQKQYDWINRPAGAAIPTNDWWTQILEAPFARGLWSYPQKLSDTPEGVHFTLVERVKIKPGDVAAGMGEDLLIGDAAGTTFTRDALLDYGDWTVHYRMEQTGRNGIDVTIGRGLPWAWCEFKGIEPALTLPNGATLVNATGQAAGDSFTGDAVRINQGTESIGVFAPPGTSFTQANGKLLPHFAGGAHYLVLAALPDNTTATFAHFARDAYAMPRAGDGQSSSTFGYAYDATAGTLKTTWSLHLIALKPGAPLETLQGWLPQHLEEATSKPAILNGISYPCIQGTIHLAAGDEFTFVQPAPNVPFALPAPKSIGGAADYSPAQMTDYIHEFIKDRTDANATRDAGKTRLKYGNDTYWGGKQPQEYAEWALLCKSLGDDADYQIFLDNLRVIMTDWMTYTPGEKEHYFAYYPDSGALIGFNPSYGSENFTDNMFHDGYFTSSAGVLAMLDPAWGKQYGAMATMVAREYANWDRPKLTGDVQRLPYFRTFEFWIGHSYAGGTGDARGNNEESSSEAMQSWLGLILLGQALHDQRMTDAGMMGYTLESRAVLYQWFDMKHESFEAAGAGYDRSNVAINYDDAKGYYTWFGANPEWILGIETLPIWPGLDFLGTYPAAARDAMNLMLKERVAKSHNPAEGTLDSLDDGRGANDWLDILIGYESFYDPQGAAADLQGLIARNTPTGKAGSTGLFYYTVQAYRTYGARDWGRHLSVPLGAVYRKADTGVRTAVAYNSGASAMDVKVVDGAGKVVGTFSAAPGRVTVMVLRSAK